MTLAVSSRNRARPQPSPSAADVSCGSGRGADEQVGRRAGTRWQNAKAGNCFGWCEVGVVKEHRPRKAVLRRVSIRLDALERWALSLQRNKDAGKPDVE
jgi:hypothetical protein